MMKQTHKRLSALLLAICLVLSMAVPAVWAEEVTSVVYNFDYQTAVDEVSTELKDGGNSLYKNSTLSEKIVNYMNDYYAGTEYGTLNWKYAALSVSGNVEFDTGYSMMAKAQVGEWIALWIKSPGAGTYNVSLTYYGTTSGASESQVYLMPMAADTDTLEAAILAGMTEANLVNKDQTVSFCDSNGSSEKPSNNATKEGYGTTTTQIGTLIDDGTVTDYILVFKATAQTTVESKQPYAYMYPAQLTMTPVTGEATDVAQVGNDKFTDLASAITAASNGETKKVDLLANCTGTDITISDGVTLDLKGNNLTANTVTILNGGSVIDTGETAGLLTATLSASGSNGGYLPLKTSEGAYSFYEAKVNVSSAAEGQLKFQVKFTKNAGYDALAADSSNAKIGGAFAWTVTGGEAKTDTHYISYEDSVTLAQKWGQMVKDKNYANGWIVLTFTGLDGFDALSVAPRIESEGVTIQADAQTLKSAG